MDPLSSPETGWSWRSSLILGMGILLPIYIFYVITYRLLFHPLAKYPGPLLAKITSWYDFYYIVKGDRHIEIWRLHEIYGPIVRFRPNSVSINTPTALQNIYSSRKSNLIKGDWYKFTHAATKGQANTHSIVDREAHAIKRRVLSQAFSDAALRSMEEHIVDKVRIWCSQIAGPQEDRDTDGWSKATNTATWANYLIFDIIGQLAFGQSFELTQREENRYVLHLLNQMMRFVYTAGYAPFEAVARRIVATKWLNDIVGGEVARDQQKMISFARDAMARRLKEEEIRKNTDDEQKDIFHYLLRAKDPQTGAEFSPEELSSESELLLIAGGDTTSTVLSGCLFYLSHNSQAMQRVTSEIRSNFDDVEDIRPSNLNLGRLPYLRACIDETMRMSPPVLGPLPRKVLTGGALIDGEYYAPGTEVAVTTYALHHREENFPDRFCFRPERWIVDSKTGVTEVDVATAQAAFAPFSIGPRNCIGKSLAYMELTTAIGRLLWMYDLKMVNMEPTAEGSEDKVWGRRRKGECQLADFFVAERDGPFLAFKAR